MKTKLLIITLLAILSATFISGCGCQKTTPTEPQETEGFISTEETTTAPTVSITARPMTPSNYTEPTTISTEPVTENHNDEVTNSPTDETDKPTVPPMDDSDYAIVL